MQKIYHCGREFVKPEPPREYPYLLCVFDAREASIGLFDGHRIVVKWHGHSNVPGKHGRGGQSQRRFERNRELALKHWFKKIVEKIRIFAAREYGTYRELVLGCCGLNAGKLKEHIPGYIRIIEVRSVQYTCENGLWELVGMSRYSSSSEM